MPQAQITQAQIDLQTQLEQSISDITDHTAEP